jgi:hypothetical protein
LAPVLDNAWFFAGVNMGSDCCGCNMHHTAAVVKGRGRGGVGNSGWSPSETSTRMHSA